MKLNAGYLPTYFVFFQSYVMMASLLAERWMNSAAIKVEMEENSYRFRFAESR
ncbi:MULTISPECIES: hypothetical protein [Paenibacillus]|uniref:hypothetical protein n=1 Tax=Paenibacillus TaxID=44249 RepID=UPI00158990F4|nr:MULTISPECIES: hypothetical protein [Paenibacillus]